MAEMTDEDEERRKLVTLKRSTAFKAYLIHKAAGGEFAAGSGKGKEPIEEWCSCHNRAPCPLEAELKNIGR